MMRVFNWQLGRWLVLIFLGLKVLGEIQLVIIFVTVTSIIPSALGNLYFPEMIKFYEAGLMENVNQILKKHTLSLVLYVLFFIVSYYFFGSWLIDGYMNKYSSSKVLINYAIPSLVFTFLSGPYLNLLVAQKKFRKLAFANIIASVVFILILGLSIVADLFNAKILYTSESIAAACLFIIILGHYKTYKNDKN